MSNTSNTIKKRKTVSKQSKSKTKKSANNAINNPSRIISNLLTFQTTLKLFHWDTARYAQHKASDQLHTDLSANIDSFVEKMLGKYPDHAAINPIMKRVHVVVQNPKLSLDAMVQKVNKLKAFLIGMRFSDTQANSDLLNIRDEMLAQLNQFLYLIKLQ
jgi:DNA-binding ferritin-like protein